jgi:hypothetical protein
VTIVAAEFGPLIIETDVDAAVVGLLIERVPNMLSVIERERDLPERFLQRPRRADYRSVLDDDEFLDRSLPAILVTTANTVGEPASDGEGLVYAAWSVIITAVARGRHAPESRVNASLYGGAVRRILTQNASLRGFAGDTKWMSGRVAPVATEDGRYLSASINEFTVYVDQVLQIGAGPYVPNPGGLPGPYDPPDFLSPDDPYDPLAIVRDVTVEITGR